MALKTLNEYITRAATPGKNFTLRQPLWGEATTATTGNFFSVLAGQRIGDTLVLPTLPAGVTAYIPTYTGLLSSTVNTTVLLCKAINMGTFDIGAANVGVFTDGATMPTQNVFGTSTLLASALLVEVTTALAGAQTNVTVTYTNQSGTAAQTAPVAVPATGAVVRSLNWVPLANNDWGVQDVTAVARVSSAGPTGVIKFWGVIPIAMTSIFANSVHNFENLITSGINVQRLGAGDVLQTFSLGSNSTKAIHGDIFIVADN